MSFLLVKFLMIYLALIHEGFHVRTDTSPMINIKGLGWVRGAVGKSFFTNRTIYEFLGINYAKPPSGHRRFQPPEEFGSWRGIYDASKMRQRCPQVNSSFHPSLDKKFLNVKEDIEDCLVLNVFIPDIEGEKKKMPVLFYIHGGSFYKGSAYEFLPGFLLEEDIVLVVIQYRLGPLGFLCLHTDEIPGNMGMLDVILALRWVKKNIDNFGGDPSKVTVYGQSAGSGATSSLLLSPLVEKGLFDKMILSSASVLASRDYDDDPLASAKHISRSLGCKTEDIGEMTKCFKEAPPLDLMRAHSDYLNSNPVISGKFNVGGSSLVVQTSGTEKFLVKHPQVAFSEGVNFNVPIMGGTNRDDGTFLLAKVIDFLESISTNELRPDQQRSLMGDVLSLSGYEDSSGLLTDLLQDRYLPGPKERHFQGILPALQDIIGMLNIKYPTYNFMRGIYHAENAYAYSFNFLGNISKLRASQPDWNEKYPFPPGVAHTDELGYIFPSRSEYTERELNMVRVMTRFWTHFIKNGCPVPPCNGMNWPKMSTPFGPYLEISDALKVRHNILYEFDIATKEGFCD